MRATATSILKLIQGSKVFLIPTFQRRYTWKKDQWQQLWDDLIAESHIDHVDDQDALDGHFLGSVVLHPAPGPASTLMRHQVIDGQQRLTTILVLLAAIRDCRSEEEGWNPQSIDEQYLRNSYNDDFPDRLVPTRLDRESFVQTVRHRNPVGEIGMAYNFFISRLEEKKAAGESLAKLQDTLLLKMLIVEINTKVGDSVNSIFNTLNSKGMPLSPADLVRNEILHHIGEATAETAHEEYWIPMETALVNRRAKNPDREFVTFLWSREVARDPRVSRDNLFSMFEKRLRAQLNKSEPRLRGDAALDELKNLYWDHTLFLAIRDGSKLSMINEHIDDRLKFELERLSDWKAEPTTPIVLWILRAALKGIISQDDAADAIHTLLSFLVRRALSGIPTNQLNRLFAPIANDLDQSVREGESPAERIRTLLSGQGYYWPTNDQVIANCENTPIYASARRYAKFLLEASEIATEGYVSAELSRAQIGHIIPQAIPQEWQHYLNSHGSSEADAEAVIHTLGNLTLTESNQMMGAQDFEDKKKEFFSNSALRLNRELKEVDAFTPARVKERGRLLAGRILSTYAVGPLEKQNGKTVMNDESSMVERLRSLLQSLEVERYVRDETLVSILGAKIDYVRSAVLSLDPTLARLVRDGDGRIPDWLSGDLRAGVEQQLQAEAHSAAWKEATETDLLNLTSAGDADVEGIVDEQIDSAEQS